MFKNYLKTAIRNLGRHKAESFINLIGLCVAFTSAMLLFLSVYYEFSFDRFHAHADNIYHLYFKSYKAKEVETSSAMPVPLLPALQASYPEIKNAARFINEGALIRYNDKELSQDIKLTDPGFFTMFSFPFIKGNAQTALQDLNNVVLKESLARAVFNNENALGKIVQIQVEGAWKPFTVSAIVADPPSNSSIRYDMVIRFEHEQRYNQDRINWENNNHDVYLQLDEKVNHSEYHKKFASFINQHFTESIQRYKRDGAKPAPDGSFIQLHLQPLADIHTNTDIHSEGNTISRSYLYLLLTIGLLILTIACINFINLSMGRSFTRSREIGLRKTLGAEHWQITTQFWIEALLICLLAFTVSCVITYLLLPNYRQVFAMNINRDILYSPGVWLTILTAFLIVSVIAGGYPALMMARLNIISILKGKTSVRHSHKLRNTLIIVQFSIAVLLMICTFISWQQINYLRSKPLGYNRSQIISIPIESDLEPRKVLELVRNDVQGNSSIESITGIYNNLGRGLDGSSRTSVMGFDHKNREIESYWMGVSYDFAKTLDLKLIAGRDFSRELATDSNAVVINEKMAAQLGESNPVGVLLNIDDSQPPKTVIGVVKDFHFESLKAPIEPLTLVIDPAFQPNYILVKVKSSNLPNSMAQLKSTMKTILPNMEFKGSFLDENIERQYRREEKLGQIFISGAVIAITLSCMGLLAIVILIVSQRTREIGIRKVLGASVVDIVGIISKDFIALIAIAIVIVVPIGWFLMDKWLQSYAYRIQVQSWAFILSAVIAVFIAFLTISTQAIKAAIVNPVISLRTE